MTLLRAWVDRHTRVVTDFVSFRAGSRESFARPLCTLMPEIDVPRCSETRPFFHLRKHPERRAAAELSLAPAVPATRSRRRPPSASLRRPPERSRRTLPLTKGAQAPFDYAHRRLRADALRSGVLLSEAEGCLRFTYALSRTRRFCPPFPLETVRNSG